MNNTGFSVSRVLRVLGALLLDAVAIIIFIKLFGMFSLIAPAGSVLMLLVLLIGLAAVDVVIIAPASIGQRYGIAYSAAIGTLLVLYAVIANIVSALTIPLVLLSSTLVWYIVWQLIILVVFVLIFALVASFAKRAAQGRAADNAERAASSSVALLLSDMQGMLAARSGEPALAPVMEAFRALKERINASTPFGRIQGNTAVADLEYRIMSNLGLLQNELRANLSGENVARLQGLMEETRRMVMNREMLNIR